MAVQVGEVKAQQERFETDGYVIVRQLVPRHEVDLLSDTFMELHGRGTIPGCFAAARPDEDADPLKVYPRMMHPHRVSKTAMDYMIDARILDVLAHLLGEEPLAAQSMFYFKPPGARGQALHQDNFYLKAEPGTCVAAWMAIDRADEENGGLFIVPGSHKMDLVCPEEADPEESFTTHHVPVPEGMQAAPVALDPGDVLFFNGSVIHGSYPNRSRDRFRRAFICHYVGMSSEKIGQHYNPLYTRDGRAVTLEWNQDGGPCGEEFGEVTGPH